MNLSYSTVVQAPLEEVFTWHERPGALSRLLPPWLPARVLADASSLRDGTSVIALPGGLRVMSHHRSDGYYPPNSFVDEVSLPFGPPAWRHTHSFSEAETPAADTPAADTPAADTPAAETPAADTPSGANRTSGRPGATQVEDSVETVAPERMSRAVLAYQHRELAGDLAVHAWARAVRPGPMTVAVTGSSGLVGSALVAFLSSGGHRVVRLVRRPATGPDERQWFPSAPAPGLLDGVDAVVHLAGASIAGRFADQHKQAITASRVGPTRRLAEAAARCAGAGNGPSCFVSASGIGYYGYDRGDEVLTEGSDKGRGFLSGVVEEWEAATAPAASGGLRVVKVRTGIVQSPRGGMLGIVWPVFFAGLGGRLGSGRQWMSWVGIDDLVDIYYRALVDTSVVGPVNAVSPSPVTNATYAEVLARVLHRPAVVNIPSSLVRLALGPEAASELAEASQRVEPAVLAGLGHQFRHPQLELALRHLLGQAH